jgi:hypothetical protein
MYMRVYTIVVWTSSNRRERGVMQRSVTGNIRRVGTQSRLGW